MRLIDADALMALYEGGAITEDMHCSIRVIRQNIDDTPTIQAEPVRHGRWETVDGWDGDEYYRCSECGAEFVLIDGTPQDNDYLYCPHCGAVMR